MIELKKFLNFDNISRNRRSDSQSKRFNYRASLINYYHKKTILFLRNNESRNNKNHKDDVNLIRTYYNCEENKYIARNYIKSRKEKN